MDPLEFMTKDELRKAAFKFREELYELKHGSKKLPETPHIEDGSQNRFEKVFKYAYGWWLVHNLIAHILIGVVPITLFFKFHDWTSRKMRAGK